MSETNKKFRVRVGVLATNDRNEVLLVRHCKDGLLYYLFPGGGVRFGETLDRCARREVFEETGLVIETGKLLFTSETIFPNGRKHVIHFLFQARITGGTLETGDEPAIDEALFMPVEKVGGLTLHPPIGRKITEAWENGFSGASEHLGPLWE